jgi:regulator of protease activity HflC (stomatin/prohibitin superfamily)
MRKFLSLLLLVLMLQLTGCGVHVVDAGNIGVKKSMGKVDPDSYPPGMYFVNPLMTTIVEMDNHTQKLEEKSNVYTKDVQQADISFAINYNLKPSASVAMYSQVGYNWATLLIPQVVNGAMKNVIGKWDAIELVSNREKAAEEIQQKISAALEPDGIAVTGFQLANIQFKPEFEQAVESKQVAVQKAEQARNETVQIQEQAKQTVIAAQAQAEAMKIKSEALSQNQNLVAYEAVQRWNGSLPSIISLDGHGQILNIPALMQK